MTAPVATTLCWNCRQPLAVGVPACLWCGVAQQQRPTAAVAVASPVQHTVEASFHQAPSLSPGDTFRGTIASPGPRVGAFTIDVAAAGLLACGVGLATGSVLLGSIAAAEAAVFMWVLESRTGATLGKAILRLRVSRAETPYSPGAGRSLVRLLVTGAGFIGLAVGAWVVAGSGAFDSSRRGRSWPDKVSRTIAVALPARTRGVRSQAGVVGVGIQRPPTRLAPQMSVAPPTLQAVPAPAPAPVPAPKPAALLLQFDTGQREQIAIPGAANLGRKPAATQPGDHLISVNDPEGTVSKTHVRLEYVDTRIWVSDNGSTNGTDLLDENGATTSLPAGQRTEVGGGSRLRIGNRVFTISVLTGGTP